jgi:hypothetical protein
MGKVIHLSGVVCTDLGQLFIIEGALPMFCGVYTFFYLPNYPQTAHFLSDEERAAILADLPEQAPNMRSKTFDLDQIRALFKTPTFVPFLMIWITHGIGGWGISFVLPTVIYELGISNTAMSQVLTIPPFTLVFLILCGLAYFIHRGHLSPWVAGLGVEIVQIICYILLITVKKPIAKYIFVMIATAASQSFFAIIWPERIRAAKGTTTAGLAIGMTNAGGQLMGIVGPQIYQPTFGPTYRVSYACSIAVISTCLGAVLTTWYFVRRDDRRRAVDDTQGSRSDAREPEKPSQILFDTA